MSTPLKLEDIDLNTIFDVEYTVNNTEKEVKDIEIAEKPKNEQIIEKTVKNDQKTPKNTEKIDIISDNVTDIVKTNDIENDSEIEEDVAPGFIKCKICGQFLKVMTGTHLTKHDMTMEQYKEQFPHAPIRGIQPEPVKPLQEITYIDIDGKIRYKDNHQLVDEQALLDKFDLSKYEEMEMDFKFLAMSKSKNALQWLDDVMKYDAKKSKDKNPKYTPAVQIKAAELILQYGPPKAAQRKEVNTTIKKLSVVIGETLPPKLKAEDF